MLKNPVPLQGRDYKLAIPPIFPNATITSGHSLRLNASLRHPLLNSGMQLQWESQHTSELKRAFSR